MKQAIEHQARKLESNIASERIRIPHVFRGSGSYEQLVGSVSVFALKKIEEQFKRSKEDLKNACSHTLRRTMGLSCVHKPHALNIDPPALTPRCKVVKMVQKYRGLQIGVRHTAVSRSKRAGLLGYFEKNPKEQCKFSSTRLDLWIFSLESTATGDLKPTGCDAEKAKRPTAATNKPKWKPKQGCWNCGQDHWLSECPSLSEAEKKELAAKKRAEFSAKKLRRQSDADAKKWMVSFEMNCGKLSLFLLVQITEQMIPFFPRVWSEG
ncbi:hypothetical protein ABG067_000881 [Albugo candida]